MSRHFKTPKGTDLPLMDIKGKPYLSIQHRIMWFREEKPLWGIETEVVHANEKETRFKATIKDETGRIIADGYKREDEKGFADHYEKAQSGAIGRALGFLGYGTQFALDLEEGDRLADAPTNEIEKKPSDHHATHVTLNKEYESNDDPGSYVMTFGKFKDQTVADLISVHGAPKINSYISWLEGDAKSKKKPLGDKAQDFIDAVGAYNGSKELDQAVPKENFTEKMARLTNRYIDKSMPTNAPQDTAPWPDEEASPN